MTKTMYLLFHQFKFCLGEFTEIQCSLVYFMSKRGENYSTCDKLKFLNSSLVSSRKESGAQYFDLGFYHRLWSFIGLVYRYLWWVAGCRESTFTSNLKSELTTTSTIFPKYIHISRCDSTSMGLNSHFSVLSGRDRRCLCGVLLGTFINQNL